MSTMQPPSVAKSRAVVLGAEGRPFGVFNRPENPNASLDAAARLVKTQLNAKKVTVQHGPGFMNFKLEKDQVVDVAHEDKQRWRPSVAYYPHHLRTNAPQETVLETLGTSLTSGLSRAAVERLDQPPKEPLEPLFNKSAQQPGLKAALGKDVKNVLRAGSHVTVKAANLLPGDVLRLAVGDVVPSDCYIAKLHSEPFVLERRNVPDYSDYISVKHRANLAGATAEETDALPKPEETKVEALGKGGKSKSSARLGKFLTGFSAGKRDEKEEEDDSASKGWVSGVRVALPKAKVGSIATHGDVVQWGEAVAVVLTRSDESSWAMIWRNELRTRAIRTAEAQRQKGVQDRYEWARSNERLKVLAKTCVTVTVPDKLWHAHNTTCMVIEDDIRFLPTARGDPAQSGRQTMQELRTAGIGIGPNIDEAEFKKRYGDIRNSANAAGIAPVIVLRRSAVTHAEVCRLACALRLVVCSVGGDIFDFETPPLEFLFETGGAVVVVGSQLNSVSDLIRHIQQCRGNVINTSYHRGVVQGLNPHGVMAHVLRSGVWEPERAPPIVEEGDTDKRVQDKRTLSVFMGIVQDREEERNHLVCYIGEDWAALGLADIGLTWSRSLSPGAYEARMLAAGQLLTNSPALLLDHIKDFETRAMKRDAPSEGCAVS